MAHRNIGYVRIELLGGLSIREACTGMVAFAKRIGMPVTSDFNGVNLNADPDGDAALLEANWRKMIDSDVRIKMAFSTP